MKKGLLLLSVIGLLSFVSCCNNTNNETKCCQKENATCAVSEECKVFAEKWAKFDSLSIDEQKELIAQKKGFIEQKREELKAKIAECEQKFAGFDTLSIADQKALLDQGCCFAKHCCKESCCKESCCKAKKECAAAEANNGCPKAKEESGCPKAKVSE